MTPYTGHPDHYIRFIEEISLTALPAIQTVYYDGWVLRFAGGYTRRANSVNPLYLSTLDIDEKIRHCEKLYSAKKQPTCFKLTPTCFPADLDKQLAFHSYKEESGASIQTCDLTQLQAIPSTTSMALLPDVTDEWLSAYFELNGNPIRHMPIMRQILNSMTPQKCCAALYQGQQIVALGLGVQDRGYLGLFDIVTHAGFRRQGLGEQLMLTLLNWGKANGAQQAYLQVRTDNDPALALYEKLGFHEIYQYWYRTKEL